MLKLLYILYNIVKPIGRLFKVDCYNLHKLYNKYIKLDINS